MYIAFITLIVSASSFPIKQAENKTSEIYEFNNNTLFNETAVEYFNNDDIEIQEGIYTKKIEKPLTDLAKFLKSTG